MTRYTYSAVAALICSTVSYFYETGTSLDPHHRELMPEEFGSLFQPGRKEGRERQQVHRAKFTAGNQSWEYFARERLYIHFHRYLNP